MGTARTDWAAATSHVETVSAYEAKTHLSALIDRASKGETITITKHGHPVALLTPVDDSGARARRAAARIAQLRETMTLGTDLTIRQLIDEGRRH